MKYIYEESDVRNLVGNFIIQINNESGGIDITTDKSQTFWLEKRIGFVCELPDGKIGLQGLYYFKILKDSAKDFADYLNSSDDRFYRKLNQIELRWLGNKLSQDKRVWEERTTYQKGRY